MRVGTDQSRHNQFTLGVQPFLIWIFGDKLRRRPQIGDAIIFDEDGAIGYDSIGLAEGKDSPVCNQHLFLLST